MSQFLESMGIKEGGENVVSKLLKGEQISKTFGSTGQFWKGRKPPPPILGDPHIVNNTLARGNTEFLFKCSAQYLTKERSERVRY